MGADVTHVGAFLAGLLSFLSPCVLPLIPSYVTYITGVSFSDLQAEKPPHEVRLLTILHSLSFIGGFTLVFVLLGASATAIGVFLQEQMEVIRKVGGVLIIIFGLHVTGIFNVAALLGDRRFNIRKKPAGYLGSAVVGVAFAAGWTPCIGPILASILMVAAGEKTMYRGISLLFTYSLGLGVPFFFSAVGLHQFLVLFRKFRKHIRLIEILTGVLLIVVGVLLFTNYLSVLSRYFPSLPVKP